MEARKISNTSEEFLTWLQVERRFAQSSIISYRSRLKCIVRDIGENVSNQNSQEIVEMGWFEKRAKQKEFVKGLMME